MTIEPDHGFYMFSRSLNSNPASEYLHHVRIFHKFIKLHEILSKATTKSTNPKSSISERSYYEHLSHSYLIISWTHKPLNHHTHDLKTINHQPYIYKPKSTNVFPHPQTQTLTKQSPRRTKSLTLHLSPLPTSPNCRHSTSLISTVKPYARLTKSRNKS